MSTKSGEQPKTLKPSEIKPNPDNPRIIKDDKYKKLVQSVKDFPEMAEIRQVVLNKDRMILGGNMRFRAMVEAGWTDIPIRIVDWPIEKQREFIIKDNVSGGEWSWDQLANEWDQTQLDEWGLDLPDAMQEEKEIIEDEAPEIADTPVSTLGSVYQLGRHRIMCADATVAENVEKLMDSKQGDAVFTDPPYGVSYTGVAGSKNWEMISNDDLRGDTLAQFLAASFANLANHTKDDAGLYCWFSSKNNAQFTNALNATGWTVKQELIWNKGMSLSGADYQYAHEPVLYCQKTDGKAKWYGGRDKKSILKERRTDLEKLPKAELLRLFRAMQKESTVWEIDRDSVTTYQHPTQKPAKLAATAIRNSTEPNDIVIDLFLGSGSTLSACEQTDRTCYGMELDPKYIDVIRKRYAKLIQEDQELPDNWQELTPLISERTT